MANNYQEYSWFKDKKALLASLLNDSSSIIEDLAMPRFAENLHQLSRKVDSDAFKIQIVGTFKNGKSTFINALLGEDILPTRVLPCTAVINEIKYGEEKRAVLHFRNPLPKKLLSCIPEATLKHIQAYGMKDVPPMEIEYDQIDQYVVIPVDGDPEEISLSSPYLSVELFYPSALLKEGVEIIDSPGFNEADERTAVTLEYLDKADAIIFLLDATKACSQDEMTTIEDTLLPKGFDDMFFVVNRIDMVRREAERAEVKHYVETKVGGFTTNEVYCISALQALDGKIDNDEQLYQRSGMAAFEKRLTEFLTKDKGRIKLAQPARELKNILTKEALYKAIPNQRAQMATSLEALRARYDTAQPQLQTLEASKQQLYTQFLLKIERCQNEIKRAILGEYREIANRVETWVNEYEPTAKISFTSKSSVKKVSDEIVAYVTSKVKETFSEWNKSVLVPLVEEKAAYIFESSEKDLDNIFNEIDQIQAQITGVGVDLEGAKGWVRVAGAVGAYLGFGQTGGYLMGGHFDFKDIAKSLAVDLGVFTGLVLLGLTNPVFVIGAIVVLVWKGIVGGGKRAMTDLKSKMAPAISDSLISNAPSKADEVIKSVNNQLMKIVGNAMSAIDTEISNVKSQVETIIKEMGEGQANVDKRKQILDNSEKRLQDICSQLDAMVFELAGLK